MKYMFASDIHGSAYYCRKLLEAYRQSGAERLILLEYEPPRKYGRFHRTVCRAYQPEPYPFPDPEIPLNLLHLSDTTWYFLLFLSFTISYTKTGMPVIGGIFPQHHKKNRAHHSICSVLSVIASIDFSSGRYLLCSFTGKQFYL